LSVFVSDEYGHDFTGKADIVLTPNNDLEKGINSAEYISLQLY